MAGRTSVAWTLVLALAALVVRRVACQTPLFVEDSDRAGMPAQLEYKFGAAMVADLDGDGWDDLVLSNHVEAPMDILFRRNRTTFESVYRQGQRDRHGIAAHDFNGDGAKDVVVSQGGVFGLDPTAPLFYQYIPAQDTFQQIGAPSLGLDKVLLRGRAPRFVDMDADGDDDLLLTARGFDDTSLSELTIYRNNGNNNWENFPNTNIRFAGCSTGILTTDIDDDGILDFVCAERAVLSVLRGTGSFPEPYEDVTSQWLGDSASLREPAFVDYMTELDYDNDGRMDLYVACGLNYTLLPCDDKLFRNTGTTFVDVSVEAGIPRGGIHQEPTAGDFDLDGNIDLLIPTYGTTAGPTPNLLLMNQGNGTFRTVTDHGVNENPSLGWRGAGAASFLMDRTGRLNVVMGYERGPWRLYRNRTPKNGRRYLAYKVRDLPGRGLQARGAKVTVVAGNRTMIRRVGSDGGDTQRIPDRVHFGLGNTAVVDSVTVRFIGGGMRIKRKVKAGFRQSRRR